MRGLRSWTGAVIAALYALLFVALYVDYLRRAGTWFADLPLALAALPFTLVMRVLNGGTYAFGGDMSGAVLVAGLFGSGLAYLAGFALEAAVRALVGLLRAGRP